MSPEDRVTTMADGIIVLLIEHILGMPSLTTSRDVATAAIAIIGHLLKRDPETMMAVFDLSAGINDPATKAEWNDWADKILRIVRTIMFESDSFEDAADRIRGLT